MESKISIEKIPLLNKHGLLPEGIYDCTINDIKNRFGGYSNNNKQRILLMGKLETYLNALKKIGIKFQLIVNGSFITSKLYPNDIDIILIYPENFSPLTQCSHIELDLISSRNVRSKLGFHVLSCRENSEAYNKDIIFFSSVTYYEGLIGYSQNLTKGLLRIKL